MFLKNYTSDVPVSRTIQRIEDTLIKCGVSGITKEYGPNAAVAAVRFHIKTAFGEMTIRLPADVDKAQDALWKNYCNGDTPDKDAKGDEYFWSGNKKKKRSMFRDQAERTAWRIIQDWVEVQMSMIQMQQADTEQVFMPYLWNGRTTLYAQLKESGFKGLLPEKT